MEPPKEISLLFKRYLDGYCNDEEITALYQHFNAAGDEQELRDLIREALDSSKPYEEALMEKVDVFAGRVGENLQHAIRHKAPRGMITNRWYQVAAAILITSVAAGFFLYRGSVIHHPSIAALQNDIAPGYNQAILTLANGTKINLDSAKFGIQVGDDDIKYNDGNKIQGVILAGANNHLPESKQPDLSLSTPRGGQYQITLPDGTKVWLNAASTLKYPSYFSGDNRKVSLDGEAYFEIKEDHKKPFIVLSKNQEIRVLGTSFNVSAYADDPSVKTTLASGSIEVASYGTRRKDPYSLRLSPGEQSILSGDILIKEKVEVAASIAWKNGFFQFDDTAPMDAFAQLGRWYNLEIVYQGKMPSVHFYGVIGRNKSLASVLDILKESGVGFKIEKTGTKNKLIVINE